MDFFQIGEQLDKNVFMLLYLINWINLETFQRVKITDRYNWKKWPLDPPLPPKKKGGVTKPGII